MNNYVPNDFFSPQNPSIPTSFSDGYSYGEEVRKLITYVNGLYSEYVDLKGSNTTLDNDYHTLLQRINDYQVQLNNFITGNIIPDGSVNLVKLASDIMIQLQSWVETYMYDMHNFVSFGIEGDNFVAYIPKTWSDINFSTDINGNLVLEF